MNASIYPQAWWTVERRYTAWLSLNRLFRVYQDECLLEGRRLPFWFTIRALSARYPYLT